MTREEAIKILKYQHDNGNMEEAVRQALAMAIEALQFAEHFDLLKEFQSLQEVVRCKDCKNRARHAVCDFLGEDGFCSHGERREDGKE